MISVNEQWMVFCFYFILHSGLGINEMKHPYKPILISMSLAACLTHLRLEFEYWNEVA
jgi:hypothetical protein